MKDLIFVKHAKTHKPVADFIRGRFSPRTFSTQPIDQEDLDTLFEAASWSASSSNLQPWLYIYAHRDTPEFDQMFECLNPANQVWAKDAAVLILCVANTLTSNEKINRFATHDLGMANATMLLQAHTMNIYGRMMGGYDLSKVIETYKIPQTFEASTIIALGYLGHLEGKDQSFIEREMKPRTRKGLDSFTYSRSPFIDIPDGHGIGVD